MGNEYYKMAIGLSNCERMKNDYNQWVRERDYGQPKPIRFPPGYGFVNFWNDIMRVVQCIFCCKTDYVTVIHPTK